MKHSTCAYLLPSLALLLVSAAVSAAPAASVAPVADTNNTLERELFVVVEFDAEQSWVSETEEFGSQHYEATSTQRYELRTRLQAASQLQARNLLDLNQEKRLKAKTIHLARQAKKKLAAAGKSVKIPQTPAEKQELTRQMQEEQYACDGDAVCRRNAIELYAAVFAAIEYADELEKPTGPGRYYYYEPYQNCKDYSRVTMQLSISGEHWNKGEKEVVPFTEERAADTKNPSDDVPLCRRYLAVVDTQDEAKPLYVENFYLPSAVGQTAHTELAHTMTKSERQPMPTDVLGWITKQLRHATKSGEASAVVKLLQPLSGISEQTGTIKGQANVTMRWRFSDPDSDAGDSEAGE